jgi:hypothetical protein
MCYRRHQIGALLQPSRGGLHHRGNLHLSADAGTVEISFRREDAKGETTLTLPLDEARDLLRRLQGACDDAHRLAKAEAKEAKRDAELDQLLAAIPLGD